MFGALIDPHRYGIARTDETAFFVKRDGVTIGYDLLLVKFLESGSHSSVKIRFGVRQNY